MQTFDQLQCVSLFIYIFSCDLSNFTFSVCSANENKKIVATDSTFNCVAGLKFPDES